MNTAKRHQSGFVHLYSRRDSVAFAAIAVFCTVVATAEVRFGMAEPWPTAITWTQVATNTAAHAAPGAPMVVAK